ncbi:unnamed protein product [Arctia plantaginis]|uniref:t-SNARE coiled-coil homology domain-containing protein n=1 Tax=Arctia plantaginis TaxID=874455 RepID=A0A8S1BFA5_ARCPL|nr:unnamed protein product [Arctia plantaginis]
MRRARDGYHYQPVPRVATEDALEYENERMAEELSGKITSLKDISIELGNEVRNQEKIIRGLDDDVDRSSGFLGKTMGTLSHQANCILLVCKDHVLANQYLAGTVMLPCIMLDNNS